MYSILKFEKGGGISAIYNCFENISSLYRFEP